MKQSRPDQVLERGEYLSRAREFAARGLDLPQTKLGPDEVEAIRSAVKQRENMRRYIADNLSNEALASKFGVHRRTIEKALSYETHVMR